MFTLQKNDGSIDHGIVNIVSLVFALCQYTLFVFIHNGITGGLFSILSSTNILASEVLENKN